MTAELMDPALRNDADRVRSLKSNGLLPPELLHKINAYWRAANYLSVGQIYLYDNPLLKEPLKLSHVKPLVVGHWGTTPGQNFIYVHLNRVIKKYDLDMFYVAGPGHGGPAIVGNVYLEGTWTEIYPNITQDEAGLKKLFKQFSFPGGISSHVAPTTPGSIHEGGELGYSLSHAFGAAFDNPELIVACVVGDGEAETGPLATAWQSNKFLNPISDGAVLPILHLNGYKINNPTVLARIEHDELEQFFRGCGWTPYFVEGDEPETMHQLMTTPGLSEFISGVILYDETIRQCTKRGTLFIKVITNAGIIPGIKVDTGAKALAGFPGEKVTEGLDGLADRVKEYARMGARFAKWRAVIAIDTGLPTDGCIDANAHALARYAAICQQAGLVPIVEPEVVMDGAHDLARCFEVTEQVLRTVFNQLHSQRVMLEGMILKPNMVLPGESCEHQDDVEQVANATIKSLLRTVPAAIPGIAFLSGGQPGELASARLNAMNARFTSKLPWALTFSFARAIQQPALEIWSGKDANVKAAQQALLHRARCNSAARRGAYDATVEESTSSLVAGKTG